ncbi:MAG: tRNA adenosine(34) deaminase TadA [Planctomycetota bacterium]|nr:tRNA adenosine(34) deaminase TadA [Planctomycetota bacterium]
MTDAGPSPRDIAMMEHAIELAAAAGRDGEIPVAAVIYDDDEIIATGSNRREHDHDPTAHAEIVALREAGRRIGGWRLDRYSMAVTLEPCPMCAGALVNARLGRLLFGAWDEKAGACESLYMIPEDERLNHAVQVQGGVLEPRCAQLLSDFFKARRNR